MTLRGKVALVTGAGGFIGSHLVEALLDEGCSVRAYVAYNALSSWGWLDTFPADRMREVQVLAGDVRDRGRVAHALDGVDIVFHLAALIGIPYSYEAPESYVDTNIRGTLNILEAARAAKCSRVMVTSTSEAYGTAKYVPIDEAHPFQAQSPYAASKIAADRLAESYYRSFGTPVTIVRPFNAYGPRQSARAIIPTVISQLLSGRTQIQLGNLSPTRDFNFVRDTVGAYVAIAREERAIGEEINIATQIEVSMGDVVKAIIRLSGRGAEVVLDEARTRPRTSEVERLCGSNEKLRRLTGWRPKYSLEEGLRQTIDWFSDPANLRRYRAGSYSI